MQKNNKIIYSENQYSYLIIIPMILIILSLIIMDYFNLGDKPIPSSITFLSILFFSTLIGLFYKMSTKICCDRIEIQFGIGVIKKHILISKIDFKSIEKFKIKWYHGMGIRLLKDGWLYNVKTGTAIKFSTPQKSFAIGTNNYKKIFEVLKGLKLT